MTKLRRERNQLRRIFNSHAIIVEETIKKNTPADNDVVYLSEKSLTTLTELRLRAKLLVAT